MPAENQYLSFHGLRVHFRVIEPETELKHRLFVLSSPLTSTFNWRKLVPELAQLDCLIVLMDLPGFGESECGANVPQSNDTRAHMAWGVLDELDRQTGSELSLWHLMGHGSACQTILTMANEYPDSVRSQIHISPAFESFSLPRPRRIWGSTNIPAEDRWFDRNIADAEGFNRFSEQMFARQTDDYVLERMRHCLTRSGAKESFVHMMRTPNAPAEPARGFSPILALWGGRDPLMTEQARAALNRFIPESEKHVLKTAGHFPMETHSKAMRDYLRGWLRYVE